jgi:hypothetical protein
MQQPEASSSMVNIVSNKVDCEQQQQQLFSQYLHHHQQQQQQQQNIVGHETSYIYHPEPLLPASTNGEIKINLKKKITISFSKT